MTSKRYEGLLSSLPGLRDIDFTIDDAERDIPQITAGLRRTGGEQLTHITITAPPSLPSEKRSVSRKTMRELGLLIREQTKNLQWLCLSRVKCTDEEDLVELVESCRHVKTMTHLMLLECGTNANGRLGLHITRSFKPKQSLRVIPLHDNGQLLVEKCQLSSEMTARMWSCLRSFTSLKHLNISDSSLSFIPSPPELPSVTKLSTKRVTSQSYEGLLSSLPSLEDIDITTDDAENDIPQITAGLSRIEGQQLTKITITAQPEKKSVSKKTMHLRKVLSIDEQHEDEDDEGKMIDSVYHIHQPSASQDETPVQNPESREDSNKNTDMIRLEKHGIEVRIPPNKIYRAKDVTVEPIRDIPPELVLKETEAIISVGLRMSPSDATFDIPVIVTMPHCGIFTKPEAAEVVTYYRKSASESFTAIHSTKGSPRCVVRQHDLDLYMDHFSEIWIVALFTWAFIGKRVICTTYIPVSTPKNAKHVLFVHVRNGNIAEKVYRGYMAPLDGEQFLVKWRSGGLRITCKESTPMEGEVTTLQESEIRHLTEQKVMFTVDTRTTDENEVILHFILKQSTTKQIMVPMHLEGISETSQGITDSASLRPSTSTSVDTRSQGASAAAGEGYTSKARPTVESSEQYFDDILKTVAEQIHKDTDIDNLGVKLGIKPPNIKRYIQKNKQDNTYMGTLDMLRDWRHKTKRSEEHEQLKKALISIKHHRLADDLLKDDLANKYHSEGVFDQTGGELQIPSYGLTLSIPPGALPEGSSEVITLDVLTDVPPEITLRHYETLVTFGFQCLPSGLQFSSEKPVTLKIPHCANLIDPKKVQVVLYSMNHEGGGDRIVQTSRACTVTCDHVEILLEHFSGGFLAFIKDALSIHKRMSFMPFLPKNMPQCKELTLEFRMVNKPHGNSWRDVHEVGKEAKYQPAKDDDDEMNVKDDNMEITCQLNNYDTLREKVDVSFIRKTRHTVYFDLDFNGKADDLLVKLKVIQSMLPMEIRFRTHFLAHRGITETSPRLSAPTSVDILPQGASAADGDFSISKARLLECGTNANKRLRLHITGLLNAKKTLMVNPFYNDGKLFVEKCQLSSEMTERMWLCLRSFASLNHLTISDSCLSFPSSPPELPSVTKLSAKKVTSQSYKGLLSSLPGLRYIDITIDDAERDIAQITAGLRRRTGGQQVAHIDLTAPDSLPSEKNRVSRETMRGLGILIREQTKDLQWLWLHRVKCTDEEDLVYLIECCRMVKTMSDVWLYSCGTSEGGRLESHLRVLDTPHGDLSVYFYHDKHYRISHIG